MDYIPAIKFENDHLYILDQSLIPAQLTYLELTSLEQVYDAIKKLKVRGAPAIGIVAAYALYLTARDIRNLPTSEFHQEFIRRADYLVECRPTAVNLKWAIDRMKKIVNISQAFIISDIIERLLNESIKIHEEDRLACHQIGLNGESILSDSCHILTHCNTGSLATGGWGTALGIIYAAKKAGKNIHVYVDETRPLGQGARLTFWELLNNGIDCTLITDSTAGTLMHQQKIDYVLFGADRIARNGDVANKIGSYSIAALARFNNIPCYVAAPISTFDFNILSGAEIQIEERDAQEILQFYNYDRSLVKNAKIFNPAFDVTPASLLSGIITEKGILRQPLEISIVQTLKQYLKESE